MQLSVKLSAQDFVGMVAQMSLDEIEKVKKAIIKQEVYFRKFKKTPINEITDDFRKEGYSEGFLKDLEEGLKKSSVYAS